MSIRAAYGIFYDLPHMQYYVGLPGSAPFASLVTILFPSSLADPWQGYPGGNPITMLNNLSFGKIQSAADPRIMQLALKYVF